MLQNGQKTTKSCFKNIKRSNSQFPNTKQFIDDAMEEECQKEKIIADEVIFYKSRSKELGRKKYFLFCIEYVNPFLGFVSLMVQIIGPSQICSTIIFTCMLI